VSAIFILLFVLVPTVFEIDGAVNRYRAV